MDTSLQQIKKNSIYQLKNKTMALVLISTPRPINTTLHYRNWTLYSQKGQTLDFHVENMLRPYRWSNLRSYPGGQKALDSVVLNDMVLWHLTDRSVSRPVIDSGCCYSLSISVIFLYREFFLVCSQYQMSRFLSKKETKLELLTVACVGINIMRIHTNNSLRYTY